MERIVKSFDWRVPVILFVAFLTVMVPTCLLYVKMHTVSGVGTFKVPDNWDSSYVEDAKDYEQQFDVAEDWSTVVPDEGETFTTVVLEDVPEASFSFAADGDVNVSTVHQTASDKEIALMTENEAWAYVTNGIWTSYSTTSFNENKDKLVQLQQTNTETITVKVWYWADPKDDTNMTKVTKDKTFAVNSKLADTFRHIFEDIYNDPSKPVINLADTAMGTWVLRGKNHNNSKTMSAHSLGVAIDINPGTGSFYVNGVWYGNAYGQKPMSKTVWEQLPECHKKYHVLYNGSPIVEIFKSYGFYWGGDWKSGTDCMHLSYLGDGSSARATGIQNYTDRH